MSWNEEAGSWEPTQDILDYLGFAGVETTRDQLARLHRRRLISEPFHDQNGGRSSLARYPAGTAERMLRISQLRSSTKQLDELAWRLWWEGFDVEPDLIRTYLLKRATRWDEQLREIRMVAAETPEVEKPERDVLESVFFEHLKVGPAMVSARKRLGRGSELYAEFSALLIDLMHGDLSSLDHTDVGLFERESEQRPRPKSHGAPATSRCRRCRLSMDTPFIQLVASLDDKDIANARPVALRLLGLISSVGSIVQEVFGGSGHGRDNVGKSLMTMSDNSDEQVLSLFLTSSFLKDDRVREALPEIVVDTPGGADDLVPGLPATALPRDRGAGLRLGTGAGARARGLRLARGRRTLARTIRRLLDEPRRRTATRRWRCALIYSPKRRSNRTKKSKLKSNLKKKI